MSIVSIITASFNSEKTIAATFDSIVAQNHRPLQYIVVDGASTDNTVNIIKQYSKVFEENQIDFTWISEPDSGIYNAWNKGVRMASGSWLTFLGSDDVLLPGALEAMAVYANHHPHCDFISAKARIVRGNEHIRDFGGPWNWNTFKREMKTLHAAGWHNRQYFSKYGMFDEEFKIVGDYEILLRARDQLKVGFVDRFIVKMGGDGVSSLQVKAALKEVKTAKLKNKVRSQLHSEIDYWWVLLKIKIKQYVKRAG